jgi:hypothetical protein
MEALGIVAALASGAQAVAAKRMHSSAANQTRDFPSRSSRPQRFLKQLVRTRGTVGLDRPRWPLKADRSGDHLSYQRYEGT